MMYPMVEIWLKVVYGCLERGGVSLVG
jgi:hypothetical protein